MKFNTEEKKMIQQLVQYNWHTLETIGRFLSNTVFTKESGQQLISISQNNKEFHILFLKLDKYTQFSECRDAVNKTIQWFYLLHRLRKEGYLTLIKAKNQGLSILGVNQNMQVSQLNASTLLFANGETIDNTFQWKDKNGNKLYEPFNLGDLDSIDIKEYITSVPIISQDLFDLVEHNFISEDIRLLKKELRLAQASFAIAIAAFIVALLTYLLPVECIIDYVCSCWYTGF